MEINADINMERGEGAILFKIFFIAVFRAEGLLEIRSATESDLIIMYHRKRKNLHLKIDRKSIAETIRVIKEIDFSLIGNLDVQKININVAYGNGDALKTTFYLGVFRMLFYSLTSALKSNQHVEIYERFTPDYNVRTLKGEFGGIFSLSVADIIYGFLVGRIKRFKKYYSAKKARA